MTITHLLDTNICIYIAKNKPPSVLKRFLTMDVSEIAMSIVTYGELLYGIKKSQRPQQSKQALEELAQLISPLPLTLAVSECYADIRASLEKKGQLIGNNDLWIASHALALDIILVSNNLKEFSRIPSLKTENWV